jgi:hypothetical protein
MCECFFGLLRKLAHSKNTIIQKGTDRAECMNRASKVSAVVYEGICPAAK